MIDVIDSSNLLGGYCFASLAADAIEVVPRLPCKVCTPRDTAVIRRQIINASCRNQNLAVSPTHNENDFFESPLNFHSCIRRHVGVRQVNGKLRCLVHSGISRLFCQSFLFPLVRMTSRLPKVSGSRASDMNEY